MTTKSHLEIINDFVRIYPHEQFTWSNDCTKQTKLPVFIHVPKCGGTFIRGSFFLLNKYCCIYQKKLNQNNAGVIFIVDKSKQPFALIYVTQNSNTINPKFVIKENIHYLKTDEFLDFMSSNCFDVFAIAITSVVIKDRCQDQIELILTYLKTLYELKMFVVLRDPFERAKSLYYIHKYNKTPLDCFTSDQSSLIEFNKFLSSHYSESNWITMFLSYVFKRYTKYDYDPTLNITDDIFSLLNGYLNSTKVDLVLLPNLVSYFSKILCDIYMPLYGTLLNYHALNATSATFNSTIKAINFRSEDVDQNSLTTFKLNSKYDFLLFQQANLINKNQDG